MTAAAHHRQFRVDDDRAGERLDVFLHQVCGDLSRNRARDLIAAGAVHVDDVRRRPSYRVRAGSRVDAEVPEVVPLQAVAQDLPLTVRFEDAALLVVDKPPGMAVHPAPGTPDGTLVNALLYHCDDLSGINGVLRPGIVHRLDRDTTGLLVVAKTDAAHRGLARQLEARTVERRYDALVWGRVAAPGLVDAPLARHPRDRRRMAVVERGGRAAVTHYTPVAALGFLTRLELRLETGRTHQIRVHLQHLGHPVFGDPVYGGRTRVQGIEPDLRARARQLLAGLPRQALHAATLGFQHPGTGATMRFFSDLPADLARTMRLARDG